MGRDYVVVGGGTQGLVAAEDLAAGADANSVTVFDARAPAGRSPQRALRFETVDVLKQPRRLVAAIKEADACLVALPGTIADRVLPTILEARVPTVDMSFTPEALSARLSSLATKAGVPLVRDVGVAPGLSHILAAGARRELGGLSSLTIYVGGLPQKPPSAPFRHAVYFNAADLISEYTRPARMRRGGRNVATRPLDPNGVEALVDPAVGALEAFPSDGLRTLLSSYPQCSDMRELTLRYPGHLDYMRRLASRGALEETRGGRSPHLRTARELSTTFPGDRFPDVLIMEVQAEHRGKKVSWRVVDRRRGGRSAMARTTAFTAAAAARTLAARPVKPGCHGPEVLGEIASARRSILAQVNRRKVRIRRGSKLAPACV